MTDFTIEEALIDKYVDIKDEGKGDPLAVELIKNHFLPQGRFEEARSWRNSLADKGLRSEVDKQIKKVAAESKAVSISRVPQNKDWQDTSISGRSETTDDQQYHYDRTLGYMIASGEMVDEAEDVEICRHEWITFVARNAYTGGLDQVGAEFDTVAMAISDYIENFLLTGQLDNSAIENSETILEQVPALNNPLSLAAESRPDIINAINATFPSRLEANFIASIPDSSTEAAGGKSDEIVVTDEGIFLLRKKFLGALNGDVQFIPTEKISSIEIGSDIHTEHAGLTSTTSEYWIFTINTVDYQSYSRYLLLGSNESQINSNRPPIIEAISQVAQFYPVQEGDSWQSSGGFQTSIGYGFFF